MKRLSLILISLCIISCANSPKSALAKQAEIFDASCPKDGTCTFEIIPDKLLVFKNDDLGALYPEIHEGNNILLKFEYKRHEIPNTLDGHYSELVYLELNPAHIEVEKENQELKDVNLLFARFCYCKGQTGYYKIENGTLSIKKVNTNEYQLRLDFKTEEVPQVITKIIKSFNLKT